MDNITTSTTFLEQHLLPEQMKEARTVLHILTVQALTTLRDEGARIRGMDHRKAGESFPYVQQGMLEAFIDALNRCV